MKRAKKQYPLDAKTTFGLSTMRWTVVAAQSLMTSAFMLYLTDYSGLGSIAATVGTILLLVGRFFDAIDDPLQGWIMDSSPKTKIGKFKPFMLGGIVICTIAIIMLFNLPNFETLTGKIIWLSLAYLLYEIGYSFQPAAPIIYSLSSDPKIREKVLITPRIIEQFIAIPFSFFLSLAVVMGNATGNMKTGMGLLAIIFVLPLGITSFIGTLCVKEGPVVEQKGKIGWKDIVKMFQLNKPLWISFLSGIFGGCVFTFIMASTSYYIKWAFGPELFGTTAAIWGSLILFGIVLGTVIAPKLLKKFEPWKGSVICNLVMAIPLAILYFLSLFNINNIVIFFALMFIALIAAGMSYIPGSVLNMETMDYSLYKTGKGMEALIQSARNFLEKAQSAIASTATGAVLIAVGYIINDTGEYVGSAPVESLLSGMLLVSCFVPTILSLISAGILFFFYPLKGKVRDEMYRTLKQRREEKAS